MPDKPIAITMGEPAGVGPELIAGLWADRVALGLSPFVYIGTPKALPATTPYRILDDVSDASPVFTTALPVLDIPCDSEITIGTPSPQTAGAVIGAIDLGARLALDHKVGGIVTAPIHKAVLYEAGFNAPGHTEYLARLCGGKDTDSIMMLTAGDLRVVPVTTHIALTDVASTLTADRIVYAGMVTAADLRDRFGVNKPRIAVAGLNPHAGEGGAMGIEEATHIQPAIWQLQDLGIDAVGPLPADTLFHADARQSYDAVLCMYHDQALIPVKTVDFWGGVNVTLGLPIIRTSPDHGTAHALAGKGVARRDSLLAATRLAAELVTNLAEKSRA